jgi:uncharacterized protein DUF222
MVQASIMAVATLDRRPEAGKLDPVAEKLRTAVQAVFARVREADGEALGEALIQIREAGIDPLEAAFAAGLRRFDKSGEYRADGALSAVAWVRQMCNLSGGAAAERVSVARQLEKLPQTEKALARGAVGFQHVALIAHAADNVGLASVVKDESSLLKAARTMDPGRFAGVAREFEHRVDRELALTEANRAYERRYFHVSQPENGMVRLDGILDAEGGATLITALNAVASPPTINDERTPGQRRADALVDLCRRPLDGRKLGDSGGQRPHLVIRVSAETLAGHTGAPAAELETVGPIPAETAQRHACDASTSWMLARGELDTETSHASQTIPPATRRALVARDRAGVFNGCHKPAVWCDGHHLTWWTRGGPTKLTNLALVCREHHRMLHEGGWTLTRADGRWVARPPGRRADTPVRSMRRE